MTSCRVVVIFAPLFIFTWCGRQSSDRDACLSVKTKSGRVVYLYSAKRLRPHAPDSWSILSLPRTHMPQAEGGTTLR